MLGDGFHQSFDEEVSVLGVVGDELLDAIHCLWDVVLGDLMQESFELDLSL